MGRPVPAVLSVELAGPGQQPGREQRRLRGRYLTPAIEDRAVEVRTLPAGRGQHRAPSVPDLNITATAELGLTVLHCDRDLTSSPALPARLPNGSPSLEHLSLPNWLCSPAPTAVVRDQRPHPQLGGVDVRQF
jgi:hypothetical protein